MSIDIDNIRSLTDFRRNTKDYVAQLRDTQSLLILTVNGEAAVVVQDAHAFQATLNQLEQLEAEVKQLKQQVLKAELQIGIEQLDAGEFTTYSQDDAAALLDKIQARGRRQRSDQ